MLLLGHFNAHRDFGYSKDYVEAMWLMLQREKPDDYVISTGETHSIREFLDLAFQCVELKYKLVDLHELSIAEADKRIVELKKEDKVFVIQHPRFFRPAEVNLLLGDNSYAKKELGWAPRVKFKELIKMMVEADL